MSVAGRSFFFFFLTLDYFIIVLLLLVLSFLLLFLFLFRKIPPCHTRRLSLLDGCENELWKLENTAPGQMPAAVW